MKLTIQLESNELRFCLARNDLRQQVLRYTTGKKKRRKRTIFTCEQLSRLESEFADQQYMVGAERQQLAEALNLSETQVRYKSMRFFFIENISILHKILVTIPNASEVYLFQWDYCVAQTLLIYLLLIWHTHNFMHDI